MAVFYIDRNGIKKQLIESNKVQSNLHVTDEELRQNPEMARAAVLAELIRWDSNQSIRRKLKKDAINTLTSRYVFTWKRQEDGSIIMKCRLTVHGFKDVDRNNLS